MRGVFSNGSIFSLFWEIKKKMEFRCLLGLQDLKVFLFFVFKLGWSIMSCLFLTFTVLAVF